MANLATKNDLTRNRFPLFFRLQRIMFGTRKPFSVRNFEATGFGFTIAKIEIWNDASKPGIILNSSLAFEIVTAKYFFKFLAKINILIGLKSYENQILRIHQLMQSIRNVISPILERFVDI